MLISIGDIRKGRKKRLEQAGKPGSLITIKELREIREKNTMLKEAKNIDVILTFVLDHTPNTNLRTKNVNILPTKSGFALINYVVVLAKRESANTPEGWKIILSTKKYSTTTSAIQRIIRNTCRDGYVECEEVSGELKVESMSTTKKRILEGLNVKDAIEVLQDEVKKITYLYNFYESGDQFEFNKDDPVKFLEKYLKDMDFIPVERDWDEDDDSKGTLKKKFGYDLSECEEVDSGNTYNFTWLFPADINSRIYENMETGKVLLSSRIHLGGDIRGSYSIESYIKEFDDKDDASYTLNAEVIGGATTLIIEFKDGSSVTLDGEQGIDIDRFEIYEIDEVEHLAGSEFLFKDPEFQITNLRGFANTFQNIFDSLNSGSEADDFAHQVAGTW